MQNLLGLIANHWVAKALSLLLAIILWAVVRRNVTTATSPSRFDIQLRPPSPAEKFQIDTRTHGERKK